MSDNMEKMLDTTIRLSPDEHRALCALAAEAGVPRAEIMRVAFRRFVKDLDTARQAALRSAMESLGKVPR